MKHFLLTDSDTRLEFTSRAKAFIYVDKKQLNSWMLLSIYDQSEIDDLKHNSGDDVQLYSTSVYNPFIVQNGEHGGVEYFYSEDEALKYIASFI